MTALYVVGSIVLIFLLIGRVPVGIDAAYDSDGFRLGLRIWIIRIALGKKSGKTKKSAGEKEEKPEEQKERKQKKKPSFGFIMSLLRNGLDLIGGLITGLYVDVLKLHFTAAFADPSDTALAYAAAGTVMDALARVGRGHIRFSDLRADVDFESAEPIIDFHIVVHITVGRSVREALRFGAAVLRDLVVEKRKEKKNGKSSSQGTDRRSDGQDPWDGGHEYDGGGAHRYA